MNRLIACCGLDCERCDARIATLNDDDALREETARRWSAMNHAPEITADTIRCTGCRTEGAKFAYCGMCAIRRCASERGYETCGSCPELARCPTVGAVHSHAPEAKANLLGEMTAGREG